MITILASMLLAHPGDPIDLTGKCPHGVITQHNRNIVISGGPWLGAGTIRPDGNIVIAWVELHTGRQKMGVYTATDDGLAGVHGGDDGFVDDDACLRADEFHYEKFAIEQKARP